MVPASITLLILWWSSFILQAAIAGGMFHKKLIRELPLFFTYTIFHVVQFWVAMIAYKTSYAAYFYVYWATEILDALLTLAVMQEIFANLFQPYEALRSVGLKLFRWTLLCLVGVAILVGFGISIGDRDRVVVGLLVLQRSSLFIQAGLMFFLFLFARLFGITWRNYVFGISLGFGVVAAISGVASAIRTYVGYSESEWYSLVLTGAMDLALIIWLYYILAPSSLRNVQSSQLDRSPLSGWNQALQELLDR